MSPKSEEGGGGGVEGGGANVQCDLLVLLITSVVLGRSRRNVCVRNNRLVGLVVKAPASRAEDPGFEPRLRRDVFRVESYQ